MSTEDNTEVKDKPICPDCKAVGSIITDERQGRILCENCGYVVSDTIIVHDAWWRNLFFDYSF